MSEVMKSEGSYTRKNGKRKTIVQNYTGGHNPHPKPHCAFMAFSLQSWCHSCSTAAWSARCSASSAVSLESVEGPLGFPNSSTSSCCFLSSSSSCSVLAGGTLGLAALSRAILSMEIFSRSAAALFTSSSGMYSTAPSVMSSSQP
uniref:Uncharacterized protein n=1 Tax=Arundo donax TaxID=35708 RepID=A0A0A9EAD3_ARUDO